VITVSKTPPPTDKHSLAQLSISKSQIVLRDNPFWAGDVAVGQREVIFVCCTNRLDAIDAAAIRCV
jgi:hypothetical protein